MTSALRIFATMRVSTRLRCSLQQLRELEATGVFFDTLGIELKYDSSEIRVSRGSRSRHTELRVLVRLVPCSRVPSTRDEIRDAAKTVELATRVHMSGFESEGGEPSSVQIWLHSLLPATYRHARRADRHASRDDDQWHAHARPRAHKTLSAVTRGPCIVLCYGPSSGRPSLRMHAQLVRSHPTTPQLATGPGDIPDMGMTGMDDTTDKTKLRTRDRPCTTDLATVDPQG